MQLFLTMVCMLSFWSLAIWFALHFGFRFNRRCTFSTFAGAVAVHRRPPPWRAFTVPVPSDRLMVRRTNFSFNCSFGSARRIWMLVFLPNQDQPPNYFSFPSHTSELFVNKQQNVLIVDIYIKLITYIWQMHKKLFPYLIWLSF